MHFGESRPKVLKWCDLSFVTSGVFQLYWWVQSQSVAVLYLYFAESRPKVLKWCDLSFVVVLCFSCIGRSSPKVLLYFICILVSPDPEYWNGVTCHFTFVVVLCFSCTGGSSPKVLCLKGTYSAGTGEDSITACVVSWMFLLKAVLCLCNDNFMLHFRLAYLKKIWLLKKGM